MTTRDQAAPRRWSGWLAGALLGATTMFFSDPVRGRRRRALVRDQLRHVGVKTMRSADVAARDLANRLVGLQARARRLLFQRPDYGAADDQIVAARIRARLGRIVSHPHAVSVAVRGGQASLSGPILAHERDGLLRATFAVPGVVSVDDRLQAHRNARGIPSLQGGTGRAAMRSEFMQENWTPAARGAAVLAGGALAGYGLVRRTPLSTLLAAAALGVVVRGLTNVPLKRAFGFNAGHRAIDLQKSIEIMAPPETVFDAWTRYENFPYFMAHVLEVRDLGEQRSHWVVRGAMGARIEWNACLTETLRPTLLAWKSEPGSVVEHAGIVRFEATESGTRVHVRLSYNPPAGALGHGVAVLLGSDPKQELDDDLMRMKSFIETGVLPHDAARPIHSPAHSRI